MTEFSSHKGYKPISFVRCTVCRKLLWPWQSVVISDPYECGTLSHHECHHKYMERVITRGNSWLNDEKEENWKEYLYCEHREERKPDCDEYGHEPCYGCDR